MKNKSIILSFVGMVVSIVPPLITTVHYFPIWVERSPSATISGTVTFLGILCFVPLYKKLLQSLKTPSAPVMWGMLAALMFIMKEIANEMFVIAVVGAVSNLVGCAIFKYARKLKRRGANDG